MRLLIAAVGKMRSGPEADLFEDYCKRAAGAGRALGVHGPEVLEREAPKGLSGAKRQAREGELLLAALPANAYVVALDERGENVNSRKIAETLAVERDAGAPVFACLIGGADGHGAEIKSRANRMWSFGAATWPHMLARVMLAEQLYRAMTILSGHPYHRA